MLKAFLPFTGAALSGLFAVVVAVWKRTAPASWYFVAGMALLALESVFAGLALRADDLRDLTFWETCSFLAKSTVPGIWICFSLTYSRGEHREFLRKWRLTIGLAFLVPIGCALLFPADLFQVM